VEASFKIETGEAERIAVDWTARGGSGGTSCTYFFFWKHGRIYQYSAVESHLQTQRAAIKMLHDRIVLLVQYVAQVIAGMFLQCCVFCAEQLSAVQRSIGSAKKDHVTLRALSALLASLPASESQSFREEFDTVRHKLYICTVHMLTCITIPV
jgi:COP9 signalosome complex subunit 6